MDTVMIILCVGILCSVCFVIGAKVGQKVSNGEPIEMPVKSPLTLIKEQRENKAAEDEKARIDTILRNIDGYDGTSRGQEDVPRG